MRRLHLIEIEDQPWCPAPVRDAATDYLRFVLEHAHGYRAIAPRLRAALDRCGARRIVDLCSGGGGPWLAMLDELAKAPGGAPEVVLTDRYPNLDAFRRVQGATGGRVGFVETSVDAMAVPDELAGFRTLFTGFHHFRPEDARRILEDAVRKRQGIGVFEMTERSAVSTLGMLAAPLAVLLVTPAIRPFRWSRLLWTYLLPAVPAVALIDGVVSCLRTYTVAELRALTAGLDADGYAWEIGQEKTRGTPSPVTYLIGTPGGAAWT